MSRHGKHGKLTRVLNQLRRRARIARVDPPIFELDPLEKRLLLSFNLALSGNSSLDTGNGSTYTAYLNATGTQVSSIAQWQVDWNDGTPNTFVPGGASQTVVTHSYANAAAGDYQISAQAEINNVWYSAGSLLDSQFGTGNTGWVTSTPASAKSATTMAVQPDGKLVVAEAIGSGFGVSRYNPDGSLDTTFGDVVNGQHTGTATSTIVPAAIALQSDGKIVVGGSAGSGAAVARFNADGSLDTTFNGTGTVLTTGLTGINALAIQPNGYIVAAGTVAVQGADGQSGAARYDPTGTLDPSFGEGGIETITYPQGLTSLADAIGLQPQANGNLDPVLGGWSCTATSTGNFYLTRLNPNGSIDTTFATSGFLTGNFVANDAAGELDSSLVVQPNNMIVAAGRANHDFALLRCTANGQLDTNFGTGGKVTTDFGGVDAATSVSLESDGKIVAAGYTNFSAGNTANQFAAARYNANGTLDTSFGTGGTITTSLTGTFEGANTAAILPDGRIVAAGRSGNAVALVRVQPFNTVHVDSEVPPHVAITAPTGTGAVKITADTPLRGIVSDPNQNLTSWTLVAIPSSGDSPITLASGTQNEGYYNDLTSASFDVQLAMLKPTLLSQGTYTLKLTGTDAAGNTASATQLIEITTQLKLGDLVFPTTDVSIPAPGLSLTVSRSYGSSKANQDDGDFGPGWQMDLPDVNLRSTAAFNQSFDSPTHPAFQSGDQVYITLPGGQVDAFYFAPQTAPGTTQADDIYLPAFADANGCHATLQVDLQGSFSNPGNTSGWYIVNDNQAGWYDPNSLVGYNPNIANPYGNYYDLTTPDGTVYHINATTGEALTVTDRDGNQLDYTNYAASTGATIVQRNVNVPNSDLTMNVVRGVTMSDNTTRNYITEIDDPEGHATHYAYDTNANDANAGALLSVTDRVNRSTTYGYAPGYLLSSVTDARGVGVLLASFMGNSLVQLQDVYHQAATVNSEPFDGTSQIQQTIDQLGNITEDAYDTHGDLVREAKQLTGTSQWSVTTYQSTYGGLNLVDLIERRTSVPFFATSATRNTAQPTAWAKIDDFDLAGNLTSEIVGQAVTYPTSGDPGWTTQDAAYNSFGEPGETIDPAGNRTYFIYNTAGDLLTTFHQAQADTPPADYTDLTDTTVTRRDRVDDTYDPRGRILTTSKWIVSGGTPTPTVVLTNTYNGPFGHMDTATDNASGVQHAFTYDGNGGNGNVATDVYAYVDSGGITWNAEEDKTYDNADRVASDTTDKVSRLSGGNTVYYGNTYNGVTQSYTGVTTQTFYNAIGKVDHTIDAYGRTTSYTYDARGNLVQTLNPDGTVTRTVYDAVNRPLWTVDRYLPGSPDAGANGTFFVYDALGRVTQTERFANVFITIENDPSPNLPANSGIQRARLVSNGSQLSTSSTVYGGNGQPASTTGTDGKTTSMTYDNEGRVVTSTNALNQTTHYFYYFADNQGTGAPRRYDVVRAPDGTQTTTDYDYLGRAVKITYPDGTTTQTLYGHDGQAVPGFTITGQTITGNQVTKIDQRGIATNSFSNLDGRLTDVWQPQVPDALNGGALTSPHWHYSYNVNGQLSNTTDPKLHTTALFYDPFGRQIERMLPGNETETQTYDTFGRPWVHTDFNGNTAVDTYYPASNLQFAGLLQQAQYAGPGQTTQTVSYTYDSLQRKSTVTDPTGTTTYGYDADGNEITDATPQGTIHYVYDPATDRLIETWTGTGAITAATTDTLYGYDELGRLKSVTVQKQDGATPTQSSSNTTRYGPTGAAISTTLPTTVYNYDNVGRTIQVLYPNGTETDTDYTNYWSATNPQMTVTNKRGTTILSQFLYTFDAAHRKTSEADTILNVGETSTSTATFNWTYDNLDRLASETYGDGTTADAYKSLYSYDLSGNRYQKLSFLAANANGTTPDHTYTDSYNGDDQLASETDTLPGGAINTTTTYSYDNNGSQTEKKVQNGSGTTIEDDHNAYDARNRLVAATVGGTNSSDTYNDAGDRVGETVNGGTPTTYLVDANNSTGYSQVLEQWQGGTAPAVSFTVGMRIIAQNAGNAVSYIMPDGHGTTRQLTTYTSDAANGHVAARYDTDAFGSPLSLSEAATNTATTSILYDGEFWDATIGQYNLRARRYSPSIGRFSSRDSGISLDDLHNANLYVYAEANPINLVDPSGHEDQATLLIATAILGSIGVLLVSTALLHHQLGLANLSLPSIPVPNPIPPLIGLFNDAVLLPADLALEVFALSADQAAEAATTIAGHAADHFPGKTEEEVAEMIEDAILNGVPYASSDGRTTYIKGGIQVIIDNADAFEAGIDALASGTAFPIDSVEKAIEKFIKDNPNPKTPPQGGSSSNNP